jgi:cell division initiation protein
MKLTPSDIRQKEFHRGMRGYADAEVDEFLDEVADEFERVVKENLDLSDRLERVQQQLQHYRSIEQTLQQTLLSAQQSAENQRAAAGKEAQLVLQDAEVKARDALSEAYATRQQVEREIVLLKNAETDFRFKFRALLEGYLKQVAASEGGARARAGQFEQQAQALREAIVADAGASQPDAPAQPPRAVPQGPAQAPAAPATAPAQGASPPPGQSSAAEAPPNGEFPGTPEPPPANGAPAPAPPEQLADEDAEDTAVIAGVDQTADVRPRIEAEDDFFSDVDNKVRDNEFKW